MNKFMLEVDGVATPIWAERIQGTLWFYINGETHSVQTERRGRSGRGASAKTHPGHILAPMPGKITKVHVQDGQSVQAGSALVVMEAMKMEYTLTADLSGRVSIVQCQVGDQVTLHQLLVQLESLDGAST